MQTFISSFKEKREAQRKEKLKKKFSKYKAKPKNPNLEIDYEYELKCAGEKLFINDNNELINVTLDFEKSIDLKNIMNIEICFLDDRKHEIFCSEEVPLNIREIKNIEKMFKDEKVQYIRVYINFKNEEKTRTIYYYTKEEEGFSLQEIRNKMELIYQFKLKLDEISENENEYSTFKKKKNLYELEGEGSILFINNEDEVFFKVAEYEEQISLKDIKSIKAIIIDRDGKINCLEEEASTDINNIIDNISFTIELTTGERTISYCPYEYGIFSINNIKEITKTIYRFKSKLEYIIKNKKQSELTEEKYNKKYYLINDKAIHEIVKNPCILNYIEYMQDIISNETLTYENEVENFSNYITEINFMFYKIFLNTFDFLSEDLEYDDIFEKVFNHEFIKNMCEQIFEYYEDINFILDNFDEKVKFKFDSIGGENGIEKFGFGTIKKILNDSSIDEIMCYIYKNEKDYNLYPDIISAFCVDRDKNLIKKLGER